MHARRLHVVLAGLFVFLVSLQQNVAEIPRTQYHPDESRWLNRSHYTIDLFDPFSEVWQDRYLIRGQPPGGSYVTGIGLLLQGRDLDTNNAWDFRFGDQRYTWWNASRGNMPSEADLFAARRTSAVLGAISVLALFLIVTWLSNVAGGIAAGFFLALHPLGIYLSSLGVSDAAFTTFTALATLAGMALAAKPTWLRATVLGLLLGAGAATKLSPLFLAAGLAAIGAVLVVAPVVRRAGPLNRVLDWIPGYGGTRSRRLGWMLLCQPVITVAVFVLSYPYLWPAPIWRTRSLFEFRRAEMDNQARLWPHDSVDSRIEALERTWTMLEHRFSATGRIASEVADRFGFSVSDRGIDVPIAVAGLCLLLVAVYRKGVTSPAMMAAAVAGGQAALIIGGLRINFDRYYLPIVFFLGIGVGLLAALLWSGAVRLATRRTIADRGRNRPHLRLGHGSTQQTAD